MRFALIAACLAFPAGVAANPTGGTVTSGSATMSTSGSTLTVTTGTTGTVINWNAFSIGSGETTRFNQPTSTSVTLNRVTGPNQSSILGSLQSNGQVFLTNPNGIVFGPTANVNVAGFVASTLDISDADFLSSNLRFTASGTPGSIVNNGTLVATDGYLALIAPTIQSTTPITVGPGGLALVAGDPVTLTVSGSVLMNATAGSNISNPTIEVASIDFNGASGGSVIVVLGASGSFSGFGGTVCPTGSGFGCGGSLVPPPPIVALGPGITLSGSTTTTISTGGTTIAGGNLTVATGTSVQTTTGGAVTLQGAQLGVTLNLEKREVSF